MIGDNDNDITALVNKFKSAFANLYDADLRDADLDALNNGEIVSDDETQAQLAADLHDELERFETRKKGMLTEPDRIILANLRQSLAVRDKILALANRRQRPS